MVGLLPATTAPVAGTRCRREVGGRPAPSAAAFRQPSLRPPLAPRPFVLAGLNRRKAHGNVGHPSSEQPLSAQTTDQATESRPRPKSRWRRVLAWVALVLGCLVLLIANVALFARIVIFDTDT